MNKDKALLNIRHGLGSVMVDEQNLMDTCDTGKWKMLHEFIVHRKFELIRASHAASFSDDEQCNCQYSISTIVANPFSSNM